VTSPYGRNRFRSTLEQRYLGNGARFEVGVYRPSIGNRGRSFERRRRLLTVTSPYGRNCFPSTLEQRYLGNGASYEVGMHGGPIGNRSRRIDWRRQFRPVTSRKACDRIRCTSEAIELVRGAIYVVGNRRRASGGSERGVLRYGAGGRAFEFRLIARRLSTAAVGAGTADVDDRLKGNVSRLLGCGRRSAACRAGQPSLSLRQAPPPVGPSASLRTDYRKMEQDRDRNGVLPRKLQRNSFRRRRRPEPKRDGRL
jgi:hypothetical protein